MQHIGEALRPNLSFFSWFFHPLQKDRKQYPPSKTVPHPIYFGRLDRNPLFHHIDKYHIHPIFLDKSVSIIRIKTKIFSQAKEVRSPVPLGAPFKSIPGRNVTNTPEISFKPIHGYHLKIGRAHV